MSESPVESLEKAKESLEKDKVPALSGQESSHPFDTLRGTQSSMLQKVTMPDSFFKIVTNPNITVATRKVAWVSHLTSRSVRIDLPSLEEIPEVPFVTRLEF